MQLKEIKKKKTAVYTRRRGFGKHKNNRAVYKPVEEGGLVESEKGTGVNTLKFGTVAHSGLGASSSDNFNLKKYFSLF